MKINKEGYKIIAISGLVCLVFWLLLYYFESKHSGVGLLVTCALLLIIFWFFIVAFFREPRRVKIHDPELVFSPCDGRVVVTEIVHDDEYLKENMLQISIFMSITNVHMNWVPVSKETRVDILVTPLVTIFSGVGLSMLIAAPIGAAASQVGTLIMWATEQAPLVMGILVSVIVGVALTLPISSAAICAALGLTGLAGGAAVAGCCAQMVGFAVMSYRENGVGGLVSQGLGTSMLQMGNIVKNPRIWIPPTLASAITGPIATCIFKLTMNGAAVSSGMGTCGLVGQIGVYTGWVADVAAGTKAAITAFDWIGLVLICFVLPAILSWFFGNILRKAGWIKENDLKLM